MSQITTASAIFDHLIGRWSIDRVVSNQARMVGEAVFTPIDTDSARYHEDVALHLGGGDELEGSQDYVFRRLANGFAVYFRNGLDLFHNIEFYKDAGGYFSATAHHDCKADGYDTAYQFIDADRFQVIHKVFGPRKNYEIKTNYNRNFS